MANVLLGVTGSVAAIRAPQIYSQLRAVGHEVKIVATSASLYFFDPACIDPLAGDPPQRNPDLVILDEDEWPGREQGKRFQMGEPVPHIELRRWAHLLVIAPLDANTMAKLAMGLADNCLTCVWRAWEPERPVILAPAMNTLMWKHPLTNRHLRQLCVDHGGGEIHADSDLDEIMTWINDRCPHLSIVAPQSKQLACGDVGVGAIAETDEIVQRAQIELAKR